MLVRANQQVGGAFQAVQLHVIIETITFTTAINTNIVEIHVGLISNSGVMLLVVKQAVDEDQLMNISFLIILMTSMNR